MWIVVRCLLGDEIADVGPEVMALGPYSDKEAAAEKVESLCDANKASGELDELDFESTCHIVKLKQ